MADQGGGAPPPPQVQPDVILDASVEVVANYNCNNNENNGNGTPIHQQPMIGPEPPPPDQQGEMIGPQPPQQQQRDMSHMPDAHTLQLWNDVADNLTVNQTVVWTKAVDSLETARDYLKSYPAPPKALDPSDVTVSIPSPQLLSTLPPLNECQNPGRAFIDRYMIQIISILLEQSPMKIGNMEKECVEKSVRCGLQIVKEDLEYINLLDDDDKTVNNTHNMEGGSLPSSSSLRACPTINALGHIFCKNKNYYKKNDRRQWNAQPGLPEVRSHMIQVFRRNRGFTALVAFLDMRAGCSSPEIFPSVELYKDLLSAIHETVPSVSSLSSSSNNNNANHQNGGGGEENAAEGLQFSKFRHIISESRALAKTMMKHVLLLDEFTVKKIDQEKIVEFRKMLFRLHKLLNDLNKVGRESSSGEAGEEAPLNEFFTFWRALALKLITSQSLPLKLFGWNEIDDLIKEARRSAPPPKSYLVTGAGTNFVNGLYEFDQKKIGPDGYVRNNVELQYHYKVPKSNAASKNGGTLVDNNNDVGGAVVVPPDAPSDGAGKTITLFRCTMRSQQKWWFLSEADADQPGTDKDIDYYQLKSKPGQDALPGPTAWLTCKAGADPSPTLEAVGKLVPEGMERQTMQDKLAKWAIDNGVIELVLGDGIHREVVSRSGGLIKFLAGMCDESNNNASTSMMSDDAESDDYNTYCLQASHLLLAWKTCTNKADAAVSSQIYKLLVAILPDLPSQLAIPLIQAIQSSLDQPKAVAGGGEKQSDHFYEVSEFCCAIAKKLLADNSTNNSASDPKKEASSVDQAILALQWSVLSHKNALTLKSYDSIKDFVFSQIRKQDRTTCKLRNTFIMHTREEITKYGKCVEPGTVVEAHALHMVQLAKFLLEGCSREEMELTVTYNPNQPEMHLPSLIFKDLITYMKRRSKGTITSTMPPSRKPSSMSIAPEFNHSHSLSTRLQILRFVYGFGLGPAGDSTNGLPQNEMSSNDIQLLWDVCSQSVDRETCMLFLANASKADDCSYNQRADGTGGELRPENSMHKTDKLAPCFSDNTYIFEKLFCAPSSKDSDGRISNGPKWENIGEVSYEAFQNFDAKSARHSSLTTDALWNICLTAGNDTVASRAMNDLLSVYNNDQSTYESAKGEDNQFSSRIFAYLTDVKAGLASGNSLSSERSAERCIRILSEAIEQCSSLGGGASAVVERFRTLQLAGSEAQLEDYLNLVPHGMRGKSSCHTVSIMARRIREQRPRSNSNADTESSDEPKKKDRFTIEIHPLQTIASIKSQIAAECNHSETMIKLTSITGKRSLPQNGRNGEAAPSNLEPRIHTLPDSTLASTLRITDGSEIVVVLTDKPVNSVNINANNKNDASNDAAATTTATVEVPASANNVNTTDAIGPQQTAVSQAVTKSSLSPSKPSKLDLTGLFATKNGLAGSSDLFFDTLISVLETLPVKSTVPTKSTVVSPGAATDTHSLVWDLLLAMPTNAGIVAHVNAACSSVSTSSSSDMMAVEPINGSSTTDDWSSLLDITHYERSVYVMQILDSLLRPCIDIFSSLSNDASATVQDALETNDVTAELSSSMARMAKAFRQTFIASGGFEAVLRLFIARGKGNGNRNKMGNTCALRIIKECFFASDNKLSNEGREMITSFDEVSMSNFLRSLVGIVASEDKGYNDNAILRVLQLARMLLESGVAASGGAAIASSFTSLPNHAAETFLTSLLLWNGSSTSSSAPASTSIRSSTNIRKSTEEMILAIPLLSTVALPWLITSLKNIDPGTDGSDEFFSVLLKLVRTENAIRNVDLLRELGNVVCAKLASYPRPSGETAHIDHSTGVLCGCLKLLIALIEVEGASGSGGAFLAEGSAHILQALNITPWCTQTQNDKSYIDLIGSMFDGFISSAQSSGLSPICCDTESRKLAFSVIIAAAQVCSGGEGYRILSSKINEIIVNVAPTIRYKWGQAASVDDVSSRRSANNNSSRYSGLKNQGCTCYMNSVLQQLFMMPALRKNICSSQLPTALRTCGVCGTIAKVGGQSLVDKKIAVQWENGTKYDAIVRGYDEVTGMHLVEYCPVQVALPQGQNHQAQNIDTSSLPDLMEEYVLSEGRPGRETGAYEILPTNPQQEGEATADSKTQNGSSSEVKETPDEASSRKLLEEVQRTFVNLDEGSCGRCFDPRALVEASHCLKLEFDVWQQNDASEFAMKLLDRLETSLKKWSLEHFRYLAHTFGMKKTTQKMCKECGLKTNREEPLMNIDCQIRNMASIHESLSDVCVDQIMEGDNKVTCDNCKVKTNTVLRTAISTLPDMLVLSLKRFDLDYTTFETVKLNSRCEFDESLNMKQYTLQAKEVLEAAGDAAEVAKKERREDEESKSESGSMMELEETETKEGAEEEDPLSVLPDEDYEYKLAGVLVHAGVAQGGHYYSFIKDRTSAKWYRFDDEDVTPFDPSSIERECFGGTLKKETKYPNGHTHTIEQDQFANALMLFYEKVKPVEFKEVLANDAAPASSSSDDAPMEEDPKETIPSKLEMSNGYDVFLPEVRKSNSTHSWQSFLLTEEFQSFVKELLEICTGQQKKFDIGGDRMDITPMPSPSPTIPGEMDDWRLNIVEMSLSFVFDVLFHLPLKKDELDSWSKLLKQLFSSPNQITNVFVCDLALRCRRVRENWIRAYTIECPEEGPRQTALQIFACAIASHLSQPSEQELLHRWTHAWTLQVQEQERLIQSKRQHDISAMPTELTAEGSFQLENEEELGTSATSIGIIISFIMKLIEVCPRYVQSSIDICFFIRELASVKAPVEGNLLRAAMIQAQLIERLTCLAIRDHSQEDLRLRFPGSSMSTHVSDAISRNETHSTNIMQMNNAQGERAEYASNMILLEAIGCLLGMPWTRHEDISYESCEINRGRPVSFLTPRAVEALTAVYEESTPDGANGMTADDIHFYLRSSGSHVPPQRIEQIFERHAVTEPDGNKLLDLNGFLAYYRQYVTNNEGQVERELEQFGFRPDLTRRPEKCRWWVSSETDKTQTSSLRESIARDVAVNNTSLSQIPTLTKFALHQLYFLQFAKQNSNSISYYLLAGSSYGRETRKLLAEALGFVHRNMNSWSERNSNNDHLFVSIFTVLASIPDNKQEERIFQLMAHQDREESRCGLMTAGHNTLQGYGHQRYDNLEIARAYMDTIHTLSGRCSAISSWMQRNREPWAWMNNDPRPEMMHPMQARSDHDARRGGNPYQHSHHDQNSIDDDDSQNEDGSRSGEYEEESRLRVVIMDCGVAEINGTYKKSGLYDCVPKFVCTSRYNGRDEEFSIFRCRLTDNTRRWYISIVPMNSHPGTTQDIDFYASGAPDTDDGFPPSEGWITIGPTSGGRGMDPPPKVLGDAFSLSDDEYEDDTEGGANVVDDDQQGYL